MKRRALAAVLGIMMAGPALAGAALAADAPAAAGPEIRNIGIAVSNLERSTKFYTEAFGYKAEGQPVKIGAALAGLMELENPDLMIQFVSTGGSRIELIAFSSPKPVGDGKRRAMNQLGFTHLQIKVKDVAATLAAVKKAGGTVLDNTKLARGDAIQAIFVLDPDGTRLEIAP